MPIARFEMPDGRIARFEVPEGTTPEQAQAQIQELLAGGELGETTPTPPAAPITGELTTGQQPAEGLGRTLETETFQERALRLGAQPGVALTPEQIKQIERNQPIQAATRQLTAEQFRPLPEQEFMDPLARGTEQGLINIGSGILRGIGELRKAFGDKEVEAFLADLSASTALERTKTERATKDSPVSGFIGEVLGESLGFGAGGFGKSIIGRLLTAGGAGAAGGALSAAGRGEEGEQIAGEATLGGILSGTVEGLLLGGRAGLDALRDHFRLKKEAEAIGFESEKLGFENLLENIKRGKEISKRAKIDLIPAQITEDPFQVQATAFLGQNPETSKLALATLTRQNQQAADQVKALLNEISVPEDVGTAPIRGRKAATNIIDAAETIRRERTSPIYENAFDIAQRQGKRVDTAPIVEQIDIAREKYGETGVMGRLLDRMENLVEGPDAATPAATVAEQAARQDRKTLRRMHGIKMEIDQEIQNRLDKGTLNNFMAVDLQDIQKSLLDQMDALNTGYKKARATYASLSPAIDDLRDGLIGRIASLSDRSIDQASSILFDPRRVNPETMKEAIRTLKSVEGGADVARSLLRAEIEKRTGKIKEVIADGGQAAVVNQPAKLRNAVFGNQQQRDTLFAALKELSPESVENAEWLEQGLERAARARPGGSPTAIRQRIIERLQSTASGVIDFLTRPIESLKQLGEEGELSAKMSALGTALYDPQWAPDMEAIRKLAPTDPRAADRFVALLNKIVDFTQRTGVIQTGARLGIPQIGTGPQQQGTPQQQTPVSPQETQQALQREVGRQRERQGAQ